ncbi:antibiotic biosynthesis monooxygenase family protein [Saccharothrix stipae]
MIARLWSARTEHRHHADAYQHLFPLDALAAVAGFRGAYLLRRDHETGVEFVSLTLFESLDAIRDFAGDAHGTAHVSPAARDVLDDVDEHVRHFTVVLAPDDRAAR